MSRVVNISDTNTYAPTGIDTSQSSYSSGSNNTNAQTDTSSTTYSTLTCSNGSGVASYVTYTFSINDIPSGATITSVTGKIKARVSSTSYIATAVAQFYANTTAKGDTGNFRSTFSSPSPVTISNVGTWTIAELATARVRFTATRGTSNTSRSASMYIYGAELIVSYSISGTAYTTTVTSSVTGITGSPATQEQLEGTDVTVRIDGDSLDDLSITDNDVDISDLLERHQSPTGGTENRVLGTYALTSGGFNGSGATYFQGLVGKGIDNTKTTSNYYSSGNGTIAVFTYDMSFTNIPSNATITRVWCEVNGHAESTSQSSEYMCAQLISGSTNLSSELNFKSIGTSNSTQTLEATTIPTVAQLENMKLQCRLGYYGGAINGATCYVTYTVPASNPYYWTYTISNISADHLIVIAEAGVFIPPEEDPTYTYWPITISSINATTNPGTGTTRVVEGTNQTITISPSDPQLTLALDNGVDITSQLIGGLPVNNYTVTTKVTGATYGFNLNSTTGYYVSSNNGISKSASVARLNMNFESSCLVTIQYINYAEANYDYGMFGKLDTAVATDGLTASSGSSTPSDSTSNYQLAMASNSSSAQTISYNVPAGEHFIDIKYGKDNASDSNNDSLQWKVLSVEATSAGGDYTYTLTNINQKHSLIFVFGNVSYYFITSTGTNCKLFPDGQQVKLEGDSYSINIIPNNITDTITITDNNVNVTSQLQREDGYDKNNNPAVSYKYSLTNIQAAHNLVISSVSAGNVLYVKLNGSYQTVESIYVKVNGAWQKQSLTYLSDNNITQLIQAT